MKYIKQFFIIIAISCLGELLSRLIPAPIPAGIYGIILLFLGLLTKKIPLDAVKETAHFLVEIMPVMFIPAAVGLLDSWDALKSMLLPCCIALVPITLIVMAVSGHATQAVICAQEKKRGERK